MSRPMRSSQLRKIAIGLLVAGLVLVVLGVVYWTVPAGKLPSVLGHIAGSTNHHTKRALTATVLGLACWVGAGVAYARLRARQARRRSARA